MGERFTAFFGSGPNDRAGDGGGGGWGKKGSSFFLFLSVTWSFSFFSVHSFR